MNKLAGPKLDTRMKTLTQLAVLIPIENQEEGHSLVSAGAYIIPCHVSLYSHS